MDDQFYQEVSGTEKLVVAALVRLKLQIDPLDGGGARVRLTL